MLFFLTFRALIAIHTCGNVIGKVNRALPRLESAFVDVRRDVAVRETYNSNFTVHLIFSHELCFDVKMLTARDVYWIIIEAGDLDRRIRDL